MKTFENKISLLSDIAPIGKTTRLVCEVIAPGPSGSTHVKHGTIPFFVSIDPAPAPGATIEVDVSWQKVQHRPGDEWEPRITLKGLDLAEVESIFGYAQTLAAICLRTSARQRLSVDDRRSMKYYADLISKKSEEL